MIALKSMAVAGQMKITAVAALGFCWLAIAAGAQENGARHRFDAIQKGVEREYPSLEKLYLHLHTHPELSFHEEQTSARIAEELRAAGFEVTTGVGGTGVVGVLANGEGPTVLVRTDSDALPVSEETGAPYASHVRTTNDEGIDVGVMHACGHDIHMTSLVGAMRLLSAMRDQWKGTVIAIAQPAEERGAGARAMLADGLFDRFPRPDYALALHVDPALASGQVGWIAGYAMANVDSVDITIRGVGGHGAYPHMTRDPIVIAARVVLALQTIVSREISPIEPAVVTVGSIHGGTKHNVIPNEVHLQLTVRSYTDEVRRQIFAAIKRIVKGIAASAGVPEQLAPIVKIKDEFTPAEYNTPELVERTVEVFNGLLGPENVIEIQPQMGGEDFGEYGRVEPRIPIMLFRLGSIPAERIAQSQTEGGEPLPSLHSSLYLPEREPTIKTGVRAMTAAVMGLMQ